MPLLAKKTWLCALAITAQVCLAPPLYGQRSTTVQAVALVNGPSGEAIEIVSSAPATPQTQLVTDPVRLVIDFPNALPSRSLHNLVLNRSDVKAVRVGLFSANPPVTRVVLDLIGSLRYEVVPEGNKTLVKIGAVALTASVQPAVMTPVAAHTVLVPASSPPPSPQPRVTVHFQNGLLSIQTERASLGDVLREVQRRTGADIPIPPGTDQELVAVKVEPMPAEAALASLLNGSRFNFVLVGSAENPAVLKSVILTPKSGLPAGQVISSITPVSQPIPGPAMSIPAPASDEDDSEDADEVPAQQAPPQPSPQDSDQPH